MNESAPGAAAETARFADVAVVGSGISGRRDFLTYEIPASLASIVERGLVVWAPVRDRLVTAIVFGTHDDEPEFDTKMLLGGDIRLRLSELQLESAAWIAHETASHIGTAAALFLPPALPDRVVELVSIAVNADIPSDLTRLQRQTIETLSSLGEATAEALRAATRQPLTTILPALMALGLIQRRVELRELDPPLVKTLEVRALAGIDASDASPKQTALLREIVLRGRADGGEGWIPASPAMHASDTGKAVLERLVDRGFIERRETERRSTFLTSFSETASDTPPKLTPEQQSAWNVIEPMLVNNDSTPILLRGVTGSGKTELYLRAAAWCLRQGKSVLILAPEIALASQLVRRVAARFPNDTVVFHSALSPKDRLTTWHAIARGERKVIVGPRSALFSPIQHLGLVVLDEEHEPSYKQDNEPRYHARPVAEFFAAQHGAVVILGSATPSLESATRARRGEIKEIRLHLRVSPALRHEVDAAIDLPKVEVVDLRLELHRGNTSLFSNRLQDVVREALAQGEQALLFLNRRGSATVVLCGDCGKTLRCPFCDIPHVYHEDRKRLICHRCGFQAIPPTACPFCSGPLNFLGVGTQRLTRMAELTFPNARVARWDQDSVRRRGSQDRLLHQIESREIDIVVGTQMIAKGLDLPHVTAVGVIQADSLLQLPDFRAAERTFQLLTQVAGRAGRRRSGGRVIVQTYSPAHYAIQAASQHDFDAFFEEEVLFRRQHRYPPFTRLVRYVVRRSTDEQCSIEADELAHTLARHARDQDVEIDLMGPTPAFAHRIAGEHQWQLILRADPGGIERLLDDLPTPPGWTIDVDPQSVL